MSAANQDERGSLTLNLHHLQGESPVSRGSHPTHSRELTRLAQELRTYATPEEKHLWYDYLSSCRPRFHRQVTIGSFILDFYCPAIRLAIEVDGGQHFEKENAEYDEKRTLILEKSGIRVLRFPNDAVSGNFYGVCVMIESNMKELLKEKETNGGR